jgi:hypothetical protein
MDTFTHSKEELLEAVEMPANRRSALELVDPKEKSQPPMPEDYQQELRAAQRKAEERIAKALDRINDVEAAKTKEHLGRHRPVPAPKPHKEPPPLKAEPPKAPPGLTADKKPPAPARSRDMLGTRPGPRPSRPPRPKAPDVGREPPERTIDIDI